MFTGIIQNQGKVLKKTETGGIVRFRIGFQRKAKRRLEIGESIACEGVCLTAVKATSKYFEVDVVKETLAATTLGGLRIGSFLNLERSLRAGDPLGGHFVTGHVDGRGIITKIERRGKNWIFWFQADKAVTKLLAHKGSIAVDGISLTIQGVQGNRFKIAIIPHTLKETTLGRKKVKDPVNLEIDLITRYLKILSDELKPRKSTQLKLSKLIEQGF
ncbi:MAG: riboflavin synthase [Candidatus Omnitrophica bacterium]|nr:riboflavin synthase [Candidatus Omnitrophota bacterium]